MPMLSLLEYICMYNTYIYDSFGLFFLLFVYFLTEPCLILGSRSAGFGSALFKFFFLFFFFFIYKGTISRVISVMPMAT